MYTMIPFAECPEWASNGRFVVIDTETTGLTNEDEIIQLAAVEYENGRQTRTFACYVAPTCPINPAAEEVNGLSAAFLAENGLPPREALDRFFAFIGKDALLVGHNIRFDLRMVKNECRKFDYAIDLEAFAWCDTVLLARTLVPGLPTYRLAALIEAFGLNAENTHDALDDTLACAALFFELVTRISPDGDRLYVTEAFNLDS